MPTNLTDISGIGKKTAESLEQQGIRSKEALLRAFENKDPRVVQELNSRAIRGIREELFDRGRRFEDPELGIEVGPEQREATKKLGTKRLSDLESVNVTQAKAGDGPDISADTTLGELAPRAASGELGREGAPQPLIGLAADAAANLGTTELSSGQVQDLNTITRQDDPAETTAPSVAKRDSSLPERADRQFELTPNETARAQARHERRSRKAQRVDERREATITDDFDKWATEPSRHDFPGVDTPSAIDDFFAEGRTSSGFGLGSRTVRNRDDQSLRRGLKEIERADPEVQERALGESVEFSTSNLFSGDDNGETESESMSLF